MNKLIIKIAITILFGSIQLSLFSQSILSNVVGQYPLNCKNVNPDVSYAKFTVVSPWDISHNGNHGRVLPIAGVKPNQAYAISTPHLGETYLKGIGKGKIILDRDPFDFFALNDNDFTVAFWIQLGSTGTVLQTKSLKVVANNGNQLSFQFLNNTDNMYEISLDFLSTETSGYGDWYRVAFVYNNASQTVTLYKNSSVINTINNVTGIAEIDNINSFLAGNDFNGGLANVSFVSLALNLDNIAQLDEVMYDVTAFASRRFRYYPLDSPHFGKETISSKDAISFTGTRGTSSRFNKYSNAVNLSPNGKIELPYLFGENAATDSYDETRGVTVSLWMKIEAEESSPYEGVERVISSKDTRFSLLYGKDSSNRPLFGLQRVIDRLGNYTYIGTEDGKKYPWYNWYYDPAGFRNISGWFHIIYVQHENWTKTYVVRYLDDISCDCDVEDWDCFRGCQVHYDYNSFRSIDDVVEWGLGSLGTGYNAHAKIDDLSIYRWPMDTQQVIGLHISENEENTGKIAVNKIAQKEIVIENDLPSKLMLYPNPSKDGTFSLELVLKERGPASFEILNIAGQLMFQRQNKNLSKGNHKIQFGSSDVVLSSGLYIIKVVTKEFIETRKLIVE